MSFLKYKKNNTWMWLALAGVAALLYWKRDIIKGIFAKNVSSEA